MSVDVFGKTDVLCYHPKKSLSDLACLYVTGYLKMGKLLDLLRPPERFVVTLLGDDVE